MGNVLAAGWFRREGKLAAVQLVHTSDGSPGWRHINDSTSTPSASQHHTNDFSVNDEHELIYKSLENLYPISSCSFTFITFTSSV